VVVDPEYHYEAVNVEAQQANPSSMLWWTRRLIALRKRFRAFGRGSLEFLYPDNRKVLAFLRCYQDEKILVVANLSRFSQFARLDLSHFRELVPTELFGLVEFPRIGAEPYLLTMGPHSFFWFHLRSRDGDGQKAAEAAAWPHATLRLGATWESLLADAAEVNSLLPRFLKQQRWYQGKARNARNISVADVIPVPVAGEAHRLTIVRVDYVEAESELYVLPLTATEGAAGARLAAATPSLVWRTGAAGRRTGGAARRGRIPGLPGAAARTGPRPPPPQGRSRRTAG
jgi:maltose alpha-D-glucosyltransferase/alpha-amylase